MATAVFFHAHPDDEAIATGGTMARASALGHQVVLLVATNGEEGEPRPGVLAEGEALGERRRTEVQQAASLLGVHRVELLGYRDSGMIGEPTNDHPDSFWQADIEQAAEGVAAILREVEAHVLTVYDSHGGYGHPDHIQVHRVGVRAAELAGVERVFECTMNRDQVREHLLAEIDDDVDLGADMEDRRRRFDEEPFGLPETEITHAIDVSSALDAKRRALMAHASQIDDESFFLKMPDEMFALAFGTEWYRDRSWRRDGQAFRTDLFG